jgi:hypothetical protein
MTKALSWALVGSLLCILPAYSATILPNGETQFVDGNGAPYASGQVCFYIPATLTPKTTWKNALQTLANTSPCVTLDANGRAIIYGQGQYRQQLFDSVGNTIWDQLTQDTPALTPYFSGGTTTGSANTQALSITSAQQPAGLAPGQWYAGIAGFTNTGALTLNISNTAGALGPVSVTKLSSAGPVPLVGNEFTANNAFLLFYDGVELQLLTQNAGVFSTTITLSGAAINETAATLASAPTVAIGAAPGNYIFITGVTNISAFESVQAGTRRTLEFAGILTIQNSSAIILPAGNITTAPGNVITFISEGSGNWRLASSNISSPQRDYIAGLILSNDPVSASTVLDISAGQTTDSQQISNIVLPAFTKSTGGTWAAGSGGNGMGAGLTITAATSYHVFAIINNGLPDLYFDSSPTAANAPSGTTAFRRIGSFFTCTTNLCGSPTTVIVPFVQQGDNFRLVTAALDGSAVSLTTAYSTLTLSVPLGVVTTAYGNVVAVSGGGGIQVKPIFALDLSPSLTLSPLFLTNTGGKWQALTNTSSAVAWGATQATTGYITTEGWYDDRGANN